MTEGVKRMKKNFKMTINACFTGYIVQAILTNFVPLLFLTFQSEYGIPLTQITLLVTINFGLQLIVDLLSVAFVDKIGYRASMIIAHVCVVAGLIAMTILPGLFADPFTGLLISVMIYAVGGGLLEVLESKRTGFAAYSPLAQGLLCGKYDKEIPPDPRAAGYSKFLCDNQLDASTSGKVRALGEMAESRGQSMSQFALSWLLDNPTVHTVM